MVAAYLPYNIVPVMNCNTGTTAATTATLPAVSGRTTFIEGFSMVGSATTGTQVSCSITGLAQGTQTFNQPIGVTGTPIAYTVRFDTPLPASSTNTTIAVVSGAAGTGGLNAVMAWGFQQ